MKNEVKRKCVFSIIPSEIFEEYKISIDTFYVFEYPEFFGHPESTEFKVAVQFAPNLGKEIVSTLKGMELRTRFANSQVPYLLLLNLEEGQKMTREILEIYINSLSKEELAQFVKEARF